MAKEKKLPVSTIRYFATQTYRTFIMRGNSGVHANRTVQGITLTTQYSQGHIHYSYPLNGETVTGTMKCAKSWI